MEYFSILNLNKEPFSNSPDPEFFFQSRPHLGCLQKLELSLRLRRGLNVVLGEVGTGKTTLCRQLIRKFADDKAYETHLILDPKYSSPSEFLTTIVEMFTGKLPGDAANDWQLKETIKKYIFRRGVDEDKTVVLIVDEGQKIPKFCLEILREFLNFETNKYKLLQIVIFAQKEFEKTLDQHANFADRINLYHVLEPMSFRDTRSMIQFRLKQSSEGHRAPALFSYPALWVIYRFTRGYPRKIINLCHRSILTMIIQNRTKVGWRLVRSCVQRAFPTSLPTWSRVAVAALILMAVIALTFGLELKGLEKLMLWKPAAIKTRNVPSESSQFDSAKTQLPAALAEIQPSAGQLVKKPLNKATAKGGLDELPDTGRNTVPESSTETSAETPDFESRFPSALGQIALKRNETLWRLIEKVYGVFNEQYLDLLIQANSDINNPDEVEIGQVISVPAIPVTVKPLPQDIWWIEVEQKDRLEKAVNVLREYSGKAPSIRIIPCWSRRLGLKFLILLDEHFFDETSARNRLNKLPPGLASEGRVFSKWDKDTVFYSDPFSY
jgi:general secretion pathway protein A